MSAVISDREQDNPDKGNPDGNYNPYLLFLILLLLILSEDVLTALQRGFRNLLSHN